MASRAQVFSAFVIFVAASVTALNLNPRSSSVTGLEEDSIILADTIRVFVGQVEGNSFTIDHIFSDTGDTRVVEVVDTTTRKRITGFEHNWDGRWSSMNICNLVESMSRRGQTPTPSPDEVERALTLLNKAMVVYLEENGPVPSDTRPLRSARNSTLRAFFF